MAEALERAHHVRILLHLLKNKHRNKTELGLELHIKPTTLLPHLELLKDDGLITITTERVWKYSTVTHPVELTQLGRHVAEELAKVDELIKMAKKAGETRPTPT